MTYSLYIMCNSVTGDEYVGLTKNYVQRMRSHKSSSKTGVTHLYRAIRKYGWDVFDISIICKGSKEYISSVEKSWIHTHNPTYNVSSGGETGGYVQEYDRDQWISKLKQSRSGRKPALGMKHTEDNKELFREFGKKRWESYGTYSKDITTISLKEANLKYGISKTHYYRLKREGRSTD